VKPGRIVFHRMYLLLYFWYSWRDQLGLCTLRRSQVCSCGAACYAVTRATVTQDVQAEHHYSLPGTSGLYVLHTHTAHGIRSARLEPLHP
jgi:hypothetical protein